MPHSRICVRFVSKFTFGWRPVVGIFGVAFLKVGSAISGLGHGSVVWPCRLERRPVYENFASNKSLDYLDCFLTQLRSEHYSQIGFCPCTTPHFSVGKLGKSRLAKQSVSERAFEVSQICNPTLDITSSDRFHSRTGDPAHCCH